jgi:predicted nucleic acid-binding protein
MPLLPFPIHWHGNAKSGRTVSCLAGISHADRQQHHHLCRQTRKRCLAQWIAVNAPAVSLVSHVEVLGYHKLTDDDKKHFEEFFAAATVLPVTDEVVKQAIRLRQSKKMSLGDSLVAGTALASQRTLATRNAKDFAWIPELKLIDPFDSLPS